MAWQYASPTSIPKQSIRNTPLLGGKTMFQCERATLAEIILAEGRSTMMR